MKSKSAKVLLALGAIVGAGLIMGATLGRMDSAQMVYRGDPKDLMRNASAAPVERTDSGEEAVREAARNSPYAHFERPDLDYEDEFWPEDQAEYHYDPGFADEDDFDTRRAWRREYGREYDWDGGSRRDDARSNDRAPEYAPEPPRSDSFADSRSATPAPRSNVVPRYRSLPPASAAPPASRQPAPAPAPAPEPRSSDGQLPAIW